MNRSLVALLVLGLAPQALAQDAPERVVMTLADFTRLYDASKDPTKTPEKAPRDFALASARYVGDVVVEDGEAKSAVFKGLLKVNILKDEGWVRVPLLPTSVALRSAKVRGAEASVVLDGSTYTLITDQRGTFDVEVEFAVEVHNSAGNSGFSFQLVPSGGTEVELAVPSSEDLDFTVANARLQTDKVVGAKRVVNATLPATGSLAVSWQREVPVSEKHQEARTYAEVYTLVGVGDGLLTATTTIQHTILFAGVDVLRVDIPDGMTLLDVTGAGIREWTTDDKGDLTVNLNYAAEGSYPLTLRLEKLVGEGSLTVEAPLVRPLGVERAKGWVGVEARGNLEVHGGDATAASPVDVRSLPGSILGITSNPVLLGYKYLGNKSTIPLVVQQHEDVDVLVTLLDKAQATTMWTLDGRRLTSVAYQVRNNRRQFLRLNLPAGAELWSASVGGRAVQPARSSDGHVMIPLVRSQASGGSLSAFSVEVVYVEDGAKPSAKGAGHFAAQLPTADAPTTYVAWTVYAPGAAKIPAKSFGGTLRHVDWLSNPVPPAEMYEVQRDNISMNQAAQGITNNGGLGDGAAPVPVSLPIEGTPIYFEKLLVAGEALGVEFDYKGLK